MAEGRHWIVPHAIPHKKNVFHRALNSNPKRLLNSPQKTRFGDIERDLTDPEKPLE
jgi:hypothetical protein